MPFSAAFSAITMSFSYFSGNMRQQYNYNGSCTHRMRAPPARLKRKMNARGQIEENLVRAGCELPSTWSYNVVPCFGGFVF